MRVVVTRPQISAVRTAERLTAMGHDPVLLPLAKPVHRPRAVADAFQTPHSALIVTSAEALRALGAAGATPDPATPLFAVGDATARAARSAGFIDIRSGKGDGTDLADLIGSTIGKPVPPLLYLAGKPRAGSLETRLAELGLPLRIAEVYEMAAIAYDPGSILPRLIAPPADAVLFHSRETVIRFFDLLSPHADVMAESLAAMQVLCISERAASAVPAAFRAGLKVAQSPDEDALLALL